MKRRFWLPLLAAATLLVAWHGALLSLPHLHGGLGLASDPPRCSAAHAGSTTSHLHGPALPGVHHLCLACLVGPTFAAFAAATATPQVAPLLDAVAVRFLPRRAFDDAHLPRLRAPPAPV